MKQVFNLGGFSFSMSARFAGVVNNVWAGDHYRHNKFVVYVSSELGRCSFTMFDSYANYCAGVTSLDYDGLKGALDCLFTDADIYESSTDFYDFCAEMGYNSIEDLKSARKAFNGCKAASKKIDRVFGSYYSAVHDDLLY